LLSIQHVNTENNWRRNIFIEDGMVVFVTAYHKGFHASNDIKIIHRYLPREVGELAVWYLWLVLPFVRQLAVTWRQLTSNSFNNASNINNPSSSNTSNANNANSSNASNANNANNTSSINNNSTNSNNNANNASTNNSNHASTNNANNTSSVNNVNNANNTSKLPAHRSLYLWGPDVGTGREWSSEQLREVLKRESKTSLGTQHPLNLADY
jgi:hypothetical protein